MVTPTSQVVVVLGLVVAGADHLPGAGVAAVDALVGYPRYAGSFPLGGGRGYRGGYPRLQVPVDGLRIRTQPTYLAEHAMVDIQEEVPPIALQGGRFPLWESRVRIHDHLEGTNGSPDDGTQENQEDDGQHLSRVKRFARFLETSGDVFMSRTVSDIHP